MPITILQLSAADFHFELFPVHSPLLGESLLFSFPPLTDMLKFSGWSCLISGVVEKKYIISTLVKSLDSMRSLKVKWLLHWPSEFSAFVFNERIIWFNRIEMMDFWTHWNRHTACYSSANCVQRSDTRGILQFALRIAFSCVLHRYESQDIHRWKFSNEILWLKKHYFLK